MPPLTRQQTFQSIISWWSDSNPPGPTINLHAAAKPLMRLMYHRQALGFVKRNRGVPLSPETLEIYWSYVSWKYVSTSTKIAILEELAIRVASEEDARMLIHSNAVQQILQLLQSSPFVRSWLMHILRHLAYHREFMTAQAVSELLMALLWRVGNSEANDVVFVFDILSDMASSSEGAQGIVAAGVLHYLLDGLGAPSRFLFPGNGMDTPWLEALYASDVLLAIANWPDGAEAVVAAQVLDHVPERFASPYSVIRNGACQLLINLAQHKSTARAVMDPKLCAQLITILELHSDNYFAIYALEALGSIANWPTGAEAVVAVKVLNHLTKSLISRWPRGRQSSCDLLAALVRHESSAQAVAHIIPRERLVALLRDEDNSVRERAAKALQALDDYLAGAQAPTNEPGEPNVL
ncbi:armadillo-type protein [Mycena latifolia]|nr:armadillo-type protein [Mycena latifolia]